MENCLVTKLKGVADNDNLTRFGYFRIRMSVGTLSNNNTIRFTEASVCKVIGGTINGQSELVSDPNDVNHTVTYTGAVVSDGTYDGYVMLEIPKYTLTQIDLEDSSAVLFDVNAEDFVFSTALTNLILPNNGTINNVSSLTSILANLRAFTLNNYAGSEALDVTNLGKDGNLVVFYLLGTSNAKGSLNNLGFSNITIGSGFPSSKNVTFSIEQFVANNRTAGRTTGSCNNLFHIGRVNATFNGDVIEDKSEAYEISWTATTITFDGVTITA